MERVKIEEKQAKNVGPRGLYKRSTAMAILDCSVKLLRELEKQGKLQRVRLGQRDVRYTCEQVEALAKGEGG
jgi:hypothetical protein